MKSTRTPWVEMLYIRGSVISEVATFKSTEFVELKCLNTSDSTCHWLLEYHGIWNFRGQHFRMKLTRNSMVEILKINSLHSESIRMTMGSEISEVNILDWSQPENLRLKCSTI